MTQKLTIQQVKAKRREAGLVARARDVKTLLQWFSHDVLALAGPDLAERQELFDFIETELKQRTGKQYPTIRKLRKALHNQRDQLLAFAGVLIGWNCWDLSGSRELRHRRNSASWAIADEGLFCAGSVT